MGLRSTRHDILAHAHYRIHRSGYAACGGPEITAAAVVKTGMFYKLSLSEGAVLDALGAPSHHTLRRHTLRHIGYRIGEGGEVLPIVGDALLDSAAARVMRESPLRWGAGDGAPRAATDVAARGIGRADRAGTGLPWLPAALDHAG